VPDDRERELPLDDFSRNTKGNVMKAFTTISAVLVGFAAVIVGYGLAFWGFGLLSGTTPDNSTLLTWGVFGDFVGGTINPILTFLTFIAVLVTLFIQAQDLEATRNEAKTHENYLKSEAKKSDLQRTITIIDNGLECLLSKKETNMHPNSVIDALHTTMPEYFNEKEITSDIIESSILYENVKKLRDNNKYVLSNISNDLKHLNILLLKYKKLDEDSSMFEYHFRKYKGIAWRMVMIGLGKEDDFKIFYELRSLRRYRSGLGHLDTRCDTSLG
jgi:uncharacterized membrane protein